MTGPEPGWYPDPEDAGAARYWDGAAWTEHVHRDVSTRAPGPPPPTARPSDDGARGTSLQHDSPGPPLPPPPPAPAVGPTVPALSARTSSGTLLVVVVVLASVVIVGVLGVFSMVGATRSDVATGVDVGRSPIVPPAERREVDPDAPAAAGCVEVDPGDGDDRSHFDLATAPPPSEIYDVPLPAWGPHTAHVLPETPLSLEPLDIRILLHNLEHGAVVVWFDEDGIDARELAEMNTWMNGLRAHGFSSASGAAVFASPAPADMDVAAISLRAWGVAVDCPSWSPAVADAFVASHYGSRGQAPEASLGPYPDDGPLVDP